MPRLRAFPRRIVREFEIAIEKLEWHNQLPGAVIVRERLPSIRSERNCIKKASCPIGDNNIAFWAFPEDWVKFVSVVVEAGDDLVVATHDRAKDYSHLLLGRKFRLFTSPDHRQPLTWEDQFRADNNAREKPIKVRQTHAVVSNPYIGGGEVN